MTDALRKLKVHALAPHFTICDTRRSRLRPTPWHIFGAMASGERSAYHDRVLVAARPRPSGEYTLPDGSGCDCVKFLVQANVPRNAKFLSNGVHARD
jgi:hypothetical protein